jgi:hypothetical protein
MSSDTPVAVAMSGFGPIGAPNIERDIAIDMAKRALPLLPVLVGGCFLIWGTDGAASAAFAVAVVVVNLLLSAMLLSGAAKIGLAAIMGAAMFGYIMRLGLITAAVLLVKDQPWVNLLPLGLVLIVTHLGLLAWELRHVSLSFSAPGLRRSATTVPKESPR